MFFLMFNELFVFFVCLFFLFLNISLILFCQPYCQQVLNPDELKLFNYLNPGPRNQVQWFIPVCMRHAGEETTLGADGWPLCVCVCVWAGGFKQKALFTALRKPDVPSCHNLAMSKSCGWRKASFLQAFLCTFEVKPGSCYNDKDLAAWFYMYV